MLVYNNKLLMVGGKAIKYIPPRNLSMILKPYITGGYLYAWNRDASSQDDWPSDFGSAIWKCNSSRTFWYINIDYFRRSNIRAVGSFDVEKASYIYPAFFQLTSNSKLGWVSRTRLPMASIAAGTSSTTKSTTFTPQITNLDFETKFGTFLTTKITYFGWIAWNTDNPHSEYSWGYCTCPSTVYYSPTMTFAEQK